MTEAYKDGIAARINNFDYFTGCPYEVNTIKRSEWQEGYGYAASILDPAEQALERVRETLRSEIK